MKIRLLMAVVAFAVPATVIGLAQVATEANRSYRTEEGRANIAKTLSDPHRDERQKPKELVDALKIRPGSTVIDAGTGVGYMLPWLSKAVGPGGRVIAEDIATDFIDKARSRASQEKLGNVEFVLGSERDPKLPSNRADLILALDTYHHFDYPGEMLDAFSRALKPGGRLAIVDFYKRPNAMPNGNAVNHIRIDYDDVVREVESHGYRLIEKSDHIPDSQYMALFRKE